MSPSLEQVLIDVDRLNTQDRLKIVAHVIDELQKHESIIQNRITPELTTEPNLAAAIERRFASIGEFEIPEIIREPIRALPSFETTEV